MPTLSSGAASLRLAMMLHATTIDEVVKWADSVFFNVKISVLAVPSR